MLNIQKQWTNGYYKDLKKELHENKQTAESTMGSIQRSYETVRCSQSNVQGLVFQTQTLPSAPKRRGGEGNELVAQI